MSASTNYNIHFANKKQKYQVYTHHLVDHNDYDSYAGDNPFYDTDAPVSMILANITDRRYKPSGGNGKSNVVRMHLDILFNLDIKSKG